MLTRTGAYGGIHKNKQAAGQNLIAAQPVYAWEGMSRVEKMVLQGG